ncbi:peptidoglycan recognition protein [Streptomyces sp. NPDC029674]|uniref:peptidoglycan recognition protein family protein n=1 Tax=Streptomyces sp. NPDC029674 TaxID=3365297 RepID=UPI00384D9EBE
MRGLLASSIGVTCAAALALPLTLPASGARAAAPGAPSAAGPAAEAIPGSTQSFPLAPLGSDRSLGPSGAHEQGLARRDVRPFSLLGVVWNDPDVDLHGTVQVRARAAGTGTWSGWQSVETHNHEHAADPGTPERGSGAVRGSTAPLWVGASDGVEIRVRAERPAPANRTTTELPAADATTELPGAGTELPAAGTAPSEGGLFPDGLRLELVDPGDEPPPQEAQPQQTQPQQTQPQQTQPQQTQPKEAQPQQTKPQEAQPQGTQPQQPQPQGTQPQQAQPQQAQPQQTKPQEAQPQQVPPQQTPPKQTQPQGSTQVFDAPRINPLSAETAAASAVNADLAPLGATEIPELTKRQTEDDLIAARGGPEVAGQARPYVGPRPRIITRKGWRANEKIREKNFAYTKTVKAAFVHHTASGNNYRCSQAGSVLRSIYRYHVKSTGWRDLGYNFVVDKCGNIYEGRAGGVAKPVLGAHTLGFNSNTMGVAVLGSYSGTTPPKSAVKAVARLTAWKLGLYGANPRATTYLKSGGGNLYKKGRKVRLRVISGHRDGFRTECPGKRLYQKLGTARSTSARLQGR